MESETALRAVVFTGNHYAPNGWSTLSRSEVFELDETHSAAWLEFGGYGQDMEELTPGITVVAPVRSRESNDRYEIDLLFRPLTLVEVDIQERNEIRPEDKAYALIGDNYGNLEFRGLSYFDVCWVAADIRYQPLYFEDVVLERYGKTHCDFVEPYFSAARFFLSAAFLPLNLHSQHPCQCEFPLGYCLPGSCTPPLYQRIWVR
ncbi:MAG TPA: hypothetical protein PKD64_15515 [Pirellulaceae bacterium]|nr:hypothetical protein [Pirellulaceae bacterium]HMP70518.1 hypothetical protein [Pirellulaceae bacterium]